MKKTILMITILSMIVLNACQSQPTVQRVEMPASTTEAVTSTTAATTANPSAGLTLNEIQNATIFAPQAQKNVQLKDGKYESGSGIDYGLVEVLPQSILADLNGDGAQDAVVALAENTGGSGVFVSLVGFLSTGSGFNQTQAVLIDDRAQINSVSAANGKITVDALIHGENDVMVSPTLKVIETYQLYGNSLTLVDLQKTAEKVERKINIETPTEQESVSGNIEVKGNMPAAPFENNLRYRFYDESGSLLNEGAFKVESEDVGEPATFDNLLTLPSVADGAKLRLELTEESAKDGSPLSMASVDLVLK